MMRKLFFLLLTLLILAVASLGVLYLASGPLLDLGTRKAIAMIAAKGADYGIELTSVDFARAELISYDQAAWQNVSARVKLKKNSYFPEDQAISLRVDRVNLRLVDISTRSFLLQARGITVIPQAETANAGTGGLHAAPSRLDGDELVVRFSLDPLNPGRARAQVAALVAACRDMVKTGTCSLPVFFTGSVTFPIQRKSHTARIMIKEGPQGSSLSMNELDLVRISQEMTLKRPLSQAEISLLAANPVRAPRLLRIRDHARYTAQQAAARSASVPEDAFRHVLWSFILTREYGPAFAKQVTDAHEQGMSGNTREETIMDRNNNAVGRSYARHQAGEDSILARVLADPAVIRDPGEVAGKRLRR
ncbi:MAG: hypothetical protein L3J03_02470 [Desulfobacterales bacterium]|nr:hypothetical protein [Desulfobacterales bacterium]